ncbi:AAA family ATPase [[Kitasatospora] papulosa]|uniref:AAA family ATPase n=1 Tax=Streptomyces TaxID=1883 RepID=UPI000691F073|nr:AAA family ATPase [Streptomyces sp. NRRL S-325]
MTTFSFAPATRETAKARIALQGPGGSGKTKTALRMAERLADGGTIGVVDTERGSAKKYAIVPGRPDLGGHEFGHMPMAYCSPENLIAAVKAAEEARIAVLVIDSWSHFWAGKGGLLARVEEESQKSSSRGGKFTAWAPVNDLEQDMLDALLNFPGHVLVTMRTKNDYSMEGKTVTKVGVKTVQREGSEYEFDVVIDMIAGTGTVTKTRYEPLYNASVHHPGEDFAEVILEQLGQGVDPIAAIVDAAAADGLTLDAVLQLSADAARRNLRQADILHPNGGQPTTVDALLRERLGDVVTGLLADESMTYDRAIELHRRAEAGGWIAVQRLVEQDGETSTTTLGALIKARGTELRPAPPKAPQNSAPSSSDPAAAQGQRQTGGEAVTAPQSRKIFATLAELGLDNSDRERRLRAISLIVGRQVPTQNDLTFGEAAVVIETLDGFTGDDKADRFREHLNTLLDAAREPVSV